MPSMRESRPRQDKRIGLGRTPTPVHRWGLALLLLSIALEACESETPSATPPPETADSGTTPCRPDPTLQTRDNQDCTPAATDYTPRQSGSTTDSWQTCISDDNAYHPLDPNISSVARVAAFEDIALKLAFAGDRVPTSQDFLDARVVYTQDQGLESRVTRREDEHYPAAPAACRDLNETDQLTYADRCVGPAKIRPILNQAFEQGAQGIDPLGNAARIEAALLWFLHVSVYKEAVTCRDTPADCDSSYAYYTGGAPRESAMGLARYVKSRSPQAHDRIWDALLAVRCWRDLDNPTGTAQNEPMHQLALQQLDRALARGLALVVRQRLDNIQCPAAWETVKMLGPVLDRDATVRDATQAAALRAELEKTDRTSVNVTVAQAALDVLFPCP